MVVNSLGCSIALNVASEVRVCQVEKGAAFQLFLRSREYLQDLREEMIKRGYGSDVYTAKVLVDKNLTTLMNYFMDT